MIKYVIVFLCAVFISACAQILLKKSACDKHDSFFREYINFRVITAYAMLFVSSLMSVFAYKYLPLSTGVVLDASGYIFIAILSWKLLREKIGRQKMIGLGIIFLGIILVGV